MQQICAELAGAIEAGKPEAELDRLVKSGVDGLMAQTGGQPPHRAILGCTHFPLVETMFRKYLPPFTRLLSQPEIVADSLEDYLARHARFRTVTHGNAHARLMTTGDPQAINVIARIFWREAPAFVRVA